MAVNYKYEELFNDGSHKDLNIISNDKLIKITNSEIPWEAFELQESLCSESELRFGSCEVSVLKFTARNTFISSVGKQLKVSVVLDKKTDAPFDYGKYKVFSDTITADRNSREITAYDAMYEILNANVADWYNTVLPDDNSTVTMRQLRKSFVEYFGLEEAPIELVNDDVIIRKSIKVTASEESETTSTIGEILSGKDIITSICEINGCFGHIGRDGKFHYIYLPQMIQGLYPADNLYPDRAPDYLPYQQETGHLYPQDPKSIKICENGTYISCHYKDYICKPITKLQIRQDENDIGTVVGKGDNCYIIEGNPFIYRQSKGELTMIANNILSKIKNIVYRPFDIECVGNPCLEVGDAIRTSTKYEIIESYILQRTLKGIQMLRDAYEAQGAEMYVEQVNGVQKSIQQLKGKANTLERDIEHTRSEISDTRKGLYSEIEQTAESIKSEVAKNGAKWDTSGQNIDVSSYGSPIKLLNDKGELFYQPDKYPEKNYLDQETGYVYYSDGSNWIKSNAPLRKIEEELYTKIEQTADGIKETIAKSQRMWDLTDYANDEIIYGFGAPNEKEHPPEQNAQKKYLNQSNGIIYQVVNGSWQRQQQLILITENLNNTIEETANSFSRQISSSKIIYDTEGIIFDLVGYGDPGRTYDPINHQGAKYLDQETGNYWLSEGDPYSPLIWTWHKKFTLNKKYPDASSAFTQTDESISLKVTRGTVSSEISQEADMVLIKGNRLVVESDNFKLSRDGTVEALGEFRTNQEENYAALSGREVEFHERYMRAGHLRGAHRSNGDVIMNLHTDQRGITLSVPGASEVQNAPKYILNYNLTGKYTEHTHNFVDEVWIDKYLDVDGHITTPEINTSEINTSEINTSEINTSEMFFKDEEMFEDGVHIDIETFGAEKYFTINGNMAVTGKKNRAVETADYGTILMNALETTGAYFSDIGSGVITDGKCYVFHDDKFLQTVNTDVSYQVLTTQTSLGKISHVIKKRDYFVVCGDNNTAFDWMVIAKQKDYENVRMNPIIIKDKENKTNTADTKSIFANDDFFALQSIEYMNELETDYATQAINYVENINNIELLELEELVL